MGPQTTSLSEQRPSSRTASSPLMPTLSDNGTSDTMMLSLTRKRLRKATKPEPRPRGPDISRPSLSTTLPVESLTQRSLTNSTLVDSLPASHPARGNPEDVTATSLREENSNSTKRKWKERRSEHLPPPNSRNRICPLCRLPDRI